MNYTLKPVHISLVRAGDTVMHEGHIKTVSGNNIKKCNFVGETLFGDSYALGQKKVQLLVINSPKPKLV